MSIHSDSTGGDPMADDFMVRLLRKNHAEVEQALVEMTEHGIGVGEMLLEMQRRWTPEEFQRWQHERGNFSPATAAEYMKLAQARREGRPATMGLSAAMELLERERAWQRGRR